MPHGSREPGPASTRMPVPVAWVVIDAMGPLTSGSSSGALRASGRAHAEISRARNVRARRPRRGCFSLPIGGTLQRVGDDGKVRAGVAGAEGPQVNGGPTGRHALSHGAADFPLGLRP